MSRVITVKEPHHSQNTVCCHPKYRSVTCDWRLSIIAIEAYSPIARSAIKVAITRLNKSPVRSTAIRSVKRYQDSLISIRGNLENAAVPCRWRQGICSHVTLSATGCRSIKVAIPRLHQSGAGITAICIIEEK